jgi:hypothetical protein
MELLLDECFGVVYPLMSKLRDVERVIAGKAVGADDAVGLDLLTYDRKQRVLLGLQIDEGI